MFLTVVDSSRDVQTGAWPRGDALCSTGSHGPPRVPRVSFPPLPCLPPLPDGPGGVAGAFFFLTKPLSEICLF